VGTIRVGTIRVGTATITDTTGGTIGVTTSTISTEGRAVTSIKGKAAMTMTGMEGRIMGIGTDIMVIKEDAAAVSDLTGVLITMNLPFIEIVLLVLY
jgi:hypothetical protein